MSELAIGPQAVFASDYQPGPNAQLQGEEVQHGVAEFAAEALSLINIGSAHLEAGRLNEALSAYDGALALAPGQAAAWRNRGDVLKELKRFDEALASYDASLALAPGDAVTLWHKAIVCLLVGDLERGWPLYENRWRVYPRARRTFGCPQWRGETLGDKSILLWAEQGFGDTLQFSRYASLVAACGGRVVLEVQPTLKRLMETLAGPAVVLAGGEALPATDYHCPLMSLPLAFWPASIPMRIPYLGVESDAVARWRTRLEAGEGPRIGLAWFGNRNARKERHRSIPLAELAPLLAAKADFVSLQPSLREGDRASAHLGRLHHFDGALTDFTETAALIETLDLVITVDTAVAHLAGALGKPTWILIPFIGTCWRWMTEREDSPWYPTVRLFRQEKPGDWASVIEEVTAAVTGKTELW